MHEAPGTEFESSSPSRRLIISSACVVGAVALAVFALTASRSIEWWDSSRYGLAAMNLTITPPPGSLLLTLLGWIAMRLPLGVTNAVSLNLLAAVIATVSVMGIFAATLVLARSTGLLAEIPSQRARFLVAAIGCGALTFAFSRSFWEYAGHFTPYAFSTVMTALIVLALLRWWNVAEQPDAWRWLALAGLLVGLDFSVHRANALLVPGMLLFVLIRDRRVFRRLRNWTGASGGLVAGFSVQLLILPINALNPVGLISVPSTLSGFLRYVMLVDVGGMPSVFPRNAPFWSVQVADFFAAYRASFLWTTSAGTLAGVLATLLAGFGLISLWQRQRNLGFAFTVLLLMHMAMTIFYFNIPEEYFRTLYRHYLPVFVLVGILAAYGMAEVAGWAQRLELRVGSGALIGASLAFAAVPVTQAIRNWDEVDVSSHHFAEEFGSNELNGLPGNAILFTSGDNDSFPSWYLQDAERVRPDVRIVNTRAAFDGWYVKVIQDQDPTLPLRDWATIISKIMQIQVRTLPPIQVALSDAKPADFNLPTDTVLPGSISFEVGKNSGSDVYRDLMFASILRENRWQRPICISVTLGEPPEWLKPYLRLEGLYWRVIPLPNAPVNLELLRHNMLAVYRYDSYLKPGIHVDADSQNMGQSYRYSFEALAEAESARGDEAAAQKVRETMERVLPRQES